MNRYLKRAISLFTVCAMLFASFAFAAWENPVSAASGRSLSKKKLTMNAGTSKTLVLKKAGRKVKWKSSNSKIVKVVKTKGKHKKKAVIKAGNKSGTATIIAKVGKKKYKCRVTVKTVKKSPAKEKTEEVAEEADPVSDPASQDDTTVELTAGLVRSGNAGKEASEAFMASYTDFSVDLFRRISARQAAADQSTGKTANVMISPDSVAVAMAMIGNGASGTTLEEMRKVLGEDLTLDDYCSFLAGLNDRLSGSFSANFSQANSIWARKDLIKVKESYLQKNKDYFDAAYYEAAFNQQTVSDINSWVSRNTKSLIPSIIDRLSEHDMLVIINTTLFDGSWEEAFDPPEQGNFINAAGTAQQAEMLHEIAKMDYFKVNGAQGFSRPYKGGEIMFLGILPPENTSTDAFIESLNGDTFSAYIKGLKEEYVNLRIPKFKYDYGADIEDVLADMGMRSAFGLTSDFSEMFEADENISRLQIDRVIHKTYIQFDENGTKAAAATAGVIKGGTLASMPVDLRFERPFVYALVDTKTGVPLFIGNVRTL